MAHEHDAEAMERAARTNCDDARANRIAKLAAEIRAELSEAHERKADLMKMAIRMILRGSNVTISWHKAEASISRLVTQAEEFNV